jgi:hypothetical protein
MYRAIRTKYSENPVVAVSTMPTSGENKSRAPQFLDVTSALDVQNYEIEDVGKLAKRKGFTQMLKVAGAVPITLLKEFTTDVWIFGYGTTIAKYTISTDTVATIKNDFGAGSIFDGGRYGDYFFVCNGIGKIWRMDNSTFTLAEVAATTTATVGLTFIGSRGYAWYGDTVQYSETDTGANPPFNTWTNGTLATDGGKVNYRNAGDVRSVVPLGDNVVVFSDKGFFAFTITTFDSAGTISKTENITNYTEDFGGARGAITTEKGIFYNNEQGIWNLVSIGQLNQPFSRQTSIISNNLGNDYFENVDFSNGDITYDPAKGTIYVTCANGSDTNNLVISCKMLETSKGMITAFATISNWNISRFMNIGGVFYGASDASTTVYKLFDGYTDDGQIIGTKYRQELKLGDLETKQVLKGCYTQGFLSPSSSIKVRFNAYGETGILTNDKLKYTWTTDYTPYGMDAYNKARYNSSVYNGDVGVAGLVESFSGCRPFLRNFLRLQVNITSNDKFPHSLTWVKLDSKIIGKIRRRNLTLTT